MDILSFGLGPSCPLQDHILPLVQVVTEFSLHPQPASPLTAGSLRAMGKMS